MRSQYSLVRGYPHNSRVEWAWSRIEWMGRNGVSDPEEFAKAHPEIKCPENES